MFFEIDDNKANLCFDELLKSSEVLSKNLKESEQKRTMLEQERNEKEAKLKEATDKIKTTERQIQMDRMALAGYKSLKDETMKEIFKLKEENHHLKLDLLAERQLRKIHQTSLHNFDPQNKEYDVSAVKAVNDSFGDTVSSSLPFLNLSVEAKPSTSDSAMARVETTSYNVPSKIQKANKDTNRSGRQSDQVKPIGFQFAPPTNLTSTEHSYNAQPSSSTSSILQPSSFSFSKSQKRAFGEGPLFPTVPTTSQNSRENPFSRTFASPTFAFLRSSSGNNSQNENQMSQVNSNLAGPLPSSR